MGKKQVVDQTKEDIEKEAQRRKEKRAKATARKAKKKVDSGRVYIKATYNNTYVSVTDEEGNVIAWTSAGTLGFSGPKKATPFAASKVAEAIAEKLKRTGPFDVEVFIKGIGRGRDSVLKTLAGRGFNIQAITDVTPIPHNGPRERKRRRV